MAQQAYEVLHMGVQMMDVQMPGPEGVEAKHLVRSQLPFDQQPYMIALTANVLPKDRMDYEQQA